MPIATRPCPSCTRPNAAHKARCLYCGGALPEPAAPPGPVGAREVPDDLDALLAEALRTGQVKKLESALRTPVAPLEPAEESLVEPPVELPEAEPDHWAALNAALAAGPTRAGLLAARTHLDALLATLAEAPDEPEEPEVELIALPPFRLPWALAVDPPRDEARGREAANALQLDLSTGRMLARSEHPRVAMRSNDRMDLLARADAWQAQLGLGARVVDASSLLAFGPASLVVLLQKAGRWRCLDGGGWRVEPSELNAEGDAVDPPELRVVVPGEVAVQRFSTFAGSLVKKGERRVLVADLHGPGVFLRAVEGLTRFEGWPELQGMSAVQAFRGFLELVADTWPVACPGLKRCKPTRDARPDDDGRAVADGWPEFEEHSRICRVLLS